jgi:hypothetical protein
MGDGSASAAVDNVPSMTPFVVYIGNICVDGSPAFLSDVTQVKPQGHMRVLDWGIRPDTPKHAWSDNPGALPGRLSDVTGFTHGPAKVTCAEPNSSEQVDVNVEKADNAVAISEAFTVSFKGGSVTLPFRLVLCQHKCPASVT